jgi:hypothetical protein
VFGAWILQVLLSEVLDVPATIETGSADANVNFYDTSSSFQLGSSDYLDALERALSVENGDCRLATRQVGHYEACAHTVPEVWDSSLAWVTESVAKVKLETPTALGVLGQEAWFVPKLTGTRDPSLMSYLGMQGEDNRRKLARTFLRPTTWVDYCEQVSLDNCTSPDSFSQRAPQDESEYERMFVDGLYTGHFRKTFKNRCDINPNCTGHIADYPCGWTSYVSAQVYHLQIALEGDGKEPYCNGYSYDQLVEIWHAANATKSNVVS